MSDERPLTAFSETEADPNERTTASTTESAAITYRWQPDGAVCRDCGATTETQWRNGDVFVCPDCKSWD